MNKYGLTKGSFTRAVKVRGTFDLFNVMFKQHNRSAFDPFLNGTKKGDIDGACKMGLKNVCLKRTGRSQVFFNAGTHLYLHHARFFC